MKCNEIKGLLSEYIEGQLAPDICKEIEGHLSVCSNCSGAFDGLKLITRSLDHLPKVNTPDDFLEGIHKKIEKGGIFDRVLKTLFFPARFKVPLECAGLAATVVLAILLFRGMGIKGRLDYLLIKGDKRGGIQEEVSPQPEKKMSLENKGLYEKAGTKPAYEDSEEGSTWEERNDGAGGGDAMGKRVWKQELKQALNEGIKKDGINDGHRNIIADEEGLDSKALPKSPMQAPLELIKVKRQDAQAPSPLATQLAYHAPGEGISHLTLSLKIRDFSENQQQLRVKGMLQKGDRLMDEEIIRRGGDHPEGLKPGTSGPSLTDRMSEGVAKEQGIPMTITEEPQDKSLPDAKIKGIIGEGRVEMDTEDRPGEGDKGIEAEQKWHGITDIKGELEYEAGGYASLSAPILTAIKRLGGRDIQSEYDHSTGQLILITAEIPVEHLDSLLEELRKFGDIGNLPAEVPKYGNFIKVNIHLEDYTAY